MLPFINILRKTDLNLVKTENEEFLTTALIEISHFFPDGYGV